MRLVIDAYTDCSRGQRDPVLFQTSSSGESLLVFIDASDQAFSSCYQPLINVVKNCFSHCFLLGVGSLQDRLSQASLTVEKTIQEQFPSSTEFGEESFSTVFVALGIADREVFPLWIGSPQAKLIRKGSCIKTTSPHVTIVPGSDSTRLIVTNKTICSYQSGSHIHVDVDEPWLLRPEDILVLADHRLFALFSEGELASIVQEPNVPAKILVERAQRLQFHFAQAALVARVI